MNKQIKLSIHEIEQSLWSSVLETFHHLHNNHCRQQGRHLEGNAVTKNVGEKIKQQLLNRDINFMAKDICQIAKLSWNTKDWYLKNCKQ